MGLVGAPWNFSKVMALALRGLVPSVYVNYLDDVLVFDPDFQSHITSVERVLQALTRAGLRLKPGKCEWCKDKIDFLGHVITEEGILAQRILDKVDHFKRPRNIRQIRAFLGLCSYYRSFLPRFAQLAMPLYELLKKETKFSWDERRERSFLALKRGFTSPPPLLVHPDFSQTFYFLTDASDFACGAALCHRLDGIYRPIAFYGVTMNSAERKYTVSEKEALSLIRSLRSFQDMLDGPSIVVVTDHKPLLSLLENAYKAPSNRLKRWSLFLSGFDITFTYEAGKTHFLADYLSRVQDMDPPELECVPPVGDEFFSEKKYCGALSSADDDKTVADIDIVRLRREQQKDGYCRTLLEYIRDGVLPENRMDAVRIVAEAEYMDVCPPGLLCHFPKIRHQSRKYQKLQAQVVVPRGLVNDVLYLMHNDILCGGHVGTRAVMDKVISRFYWKGMMSDITEYVKQCGVCALRKRIPHPQAPAKSWDRPSYPFQWVCCDFIGPLKVANGFKYILTFIDLCTGWPEAFLTKD